MTPRSMSTGLFASFSTAKYNWITTLDKKLDTPATTLAFTGDKK